jgi:hypothetical protein
MPTHRDKPEGFDEAAARRSRELDEAIERSREARRDRALAELRAKDEVRRSSSVPPLGRRASFGDRSDYCSARCAGPYAAASAVVLNAVSSGSTMPFAQQA